MVKDFSEFKEGFDMELLGAALRRGESFVGMEERIDINCTGGKAAPVVEKTQTCRITDKFIEANFDKLLALKIIKHR
ncbi:hypothetical protein [Fusobacterium sp.]|uniref:hypothetical protein n=1 Tax=Fusobacterium sp. TaxID=68766 RepID=UPI00396C901B